MSSKATHSICACFLETRHTEFPQSERWSGVVKLKEFWKLIVENYFKYFIGKLKFSYN